MIDITHLQRFNPWWTEKVVPDYLLGKFFRAYLKRILDQLNKRFINLLYGLRRVGKTTLLYQIIQDLLSQKIDPFTILYFSFDDRRANLDDIIKLYEEKVLKKKLTQIPKVYFFFDEIQKLADWQSQIKILYDLYPQLKIFLSGSASVSLQQSSKESLAGRLIDFYIKPLSFSEFLDWKGIKIDQSRPELSQSIVMPYLMDYLRKGGFPEMIAEEKDEVIKQYIKNTIIDRIIYRDLPEEFALKDVELLSLLSELFMRDPGMIINFDRLARDLKRNKITITNYVHYLQYALFIREVKNLRAGFLVSSRKNRKIYPMNTALSFAYREDFYSEQFLQKIAEIVVADKIEAQYYYRNCLEVDFIVKQGSSIMPVEVKYGQPHLKQVLDFMQEWRVKKGILVSKDIFREESNINIIPLWLFLLREKEE